MSTPTIPPAPVSTGSGDVPIGDTLNIYTVETFGAACKARLAQNPETTIDLSAVTTCDSLGIQVLCAARRSALVTRKSLRFANVSPAVLKAAAAIGCEGIFTSDSIPS